MPRVSHSRIPRNRITSFPVAANAVQIEYDFGYGLSVFLSSFGHLENDFLAGVIGTFEPLSVPLFFYLDQRSVFEIAGSISRDIHFGTDICIFLEQCQQHIKELFQAGKTSFQYEMPSTKGTITTSPDKNTPLYRPFKRCPSTIVTKSLRNWRNWGLGNCILRSPNSSIKTPHQLGYSISEKSSMSLVELIWEVFPL